MIAVDRRLILLSGLFCILALAASASHAQIKSADSIPQANLIEPGDFAEQLKKSAALPKPVILHVGFRKLYAQAHIPGSDYAGPGGDEDGLKSLSERVEKLPKDTSIVIYCGCCPWGHCPNVAAAFAKLKDMGFSQVKVLHIAENFGTDWVDKGYATITSP
jgi:thiosulfate/3-mercaptopyruvate sulfurtransferase